MDRETGELAVKEVTENTASFVAASCDHEPTIEEWKKCLQGAGYVTEQIDEILGDNAEIQ